MEEQIEETQTRMSQINEYIGKDSNPILMVVRQEYFSQNSVFRSEIEQANPPSE